MTDDRQRLCAYLRDSPGSTESVSAGMIAAARADRMHLVLAAQLGLPALAGELREAVLLEMLRQRELRRVLAKLAETRVKPILLKGAALAYTHYRKPELRPRTDVDMMIPRSSRDVVAGALQALGYQRPSEIDGELTTGQFHYDRRDRYGLFHALDVHWRISNVRAFADVLTYEELARDALVVPALGTDAWSPSPMHALIVACVHRVAHHGNSDELIWLFDVYLLARALDAHDRDLFTTFASARGIRAVCAATLRLAESAFGHIDTRWIASLSETNGADEPTAKFLRGAPRQVNILAADLAATRHGRARLQLLREHLFPAPAFMYNRYGTERQWTLPLLYLHRIVSGMPKWFRRPRVRGPRAS